MFKTITFSGFRNCIAETSSVHSESDNGQTFVTRMKLSSYIKSPCHHSGSGKFLIPFPDLEKKTVLMAHIHTSPPRPY